MDQPNGTAISSHTDEAEQIVCPFCFSYVTTIIVDDDTVICTNCNRKISEGDLDVFTKDTTITG